MDLEYNSSQLLYSGVAFTFFYLSRIKKQRNVIVLISFFSFLFLYFISWITDGGNDGPTYGVGTGFFFILISIANTNLIRNIFFLSLVLTAILCICISYYAPNFIVPYHNPRQQFIDFIVIFFQTIIPVYFVHLSNQECYHYEQQLVIEKNKALEQAVFTKNKLFAIIGHDLRGPLATLDGMVTMVHNQTLSPLEFTENAKRIQNKTGRLREMLDNLLNWSLSQTETIQINKTNISALPILLSEIATLEEELVEKGIYLEYNLTNKEVLFADADHVRIIFRNLLTNAVRYTQKNGGKITIHANRLVDTYQFIFTNSPIVISSLGTSKATIKSTGLGLILSKEFALQNGGSLETIIFDELSYKATLFLPIGKL
jgi:signal transduction histidine kinase